MNRHIFICSVVLVLIACAGPQRQPDQDKIEAKPANEPLAAPPRVEAPPSVVETPNPQTQPGNPSTPASDTTHATPAEGPATHSATPASGTAAKVDDVAASNAEPVPQQNLPAHEATHTTPEAPPHMGNADDPGAAPHGEAEARPDAPETKPAIENPAERPVLSLAELITELERTCADPAYREDMDAQAVLAAAYLATRDADYQRKAGDVLAQMALKELEPNRKQWHRLHTAIFERAIGEHFVEYEKLKEATKESVSHIPLKIVDIYHADATPAKRDKKGFYARRLLANENREDATYRPGEEGFVAIRLRFATGKYSDVDRRYYYHTAWLLELFEENSDKRVIGFASLGDESKWSDQIAPEEEQPGGFRFKIPSDIKTNTDYILKLTITDMNRAPPHRDTSEIVVKVRGERNRQ